MLSRPALGAFVAVLCSCASAAAQVELFSKAPPEIDEALRDRVGKFYQAHVDGKFRLADQYVAEDSKDAFFEADKIHYKTWKIERIDYTDDFTRAKVLTGCQSDFHSAGQTFVVTIPVLSTWKREQGQWFWYYVAPTKVETPFGVMQGRNEPASETKAAVPNIAAAAADILRQVAIDRNEVMLSSYESAKGEVTIANGMPGEITLRVEYEKAPWLSIRLDETTVKGGGRAHLLLESKPADRTPKPTIIARVIVDQTGQVLPIKVTFAVPPEILEKLRK